MDGYTWGEPEATATRRVVAVHGNDPIKSRTRWHPLGNRFTASAAPGARFCALDWHSVCSVDGSTAHHTMRTKQNTLRMAPCTLGSCAPCHALCALRATYRTTRTAYSATRTRYRARRTVSCASCCVRATMRTAP